LALVAIARGTSRPSSARLRGRGRLGAAIGALGQSRCSGAPCHELDDGVVQRGNPRGRHYHGARPHSSHRSRSRDSMAPTFATGPDGTKVFVTRRSTANTANATRSRGRRAFLASDTVEDERRSRPPGNGSSTKRCSPRFGRPRGRATRSALAIAQLKAGPKPSPVSRSSDGRVVGEEDAARSTTSSVTHRTGGRSFVACLPARVCAPHRHLAL